MSRKQSREGKNKAVTAAAPAQVNRGPDPFIERIGSGYAERTFREQWTELEALLQADVTRAHSLRGLGPEGHEKVVHAERHLHNTAALMAMMFDRLETVDFMLRDAAAKILADEKSQGDEGFVEYGQRALRDHWSQLRGRLTADMDFLSGSCLYGRTIRISDELRRGLKLTVVDIKEFLQQTEMLMGNFVWAEIEATEQYLGNVADLVEDLSRHSAERTPQRKGRSQKATRATA